MQRLFFILGFSYLFARIISTFCPIYISALLFLLLLYSFIVSLKFKNIRDNKVIPVVLFACATAFFSYTVAFSKNVSNTLNFEGKNLKINGTVYNFPINIKNKFLYIIKTEKITVLDNSNGCENKEIYLETKVMVSSSKDLAVDFYDYIEINVNACHFENLLGFSAKNKLLSKGITISSVVDKSEFVLIKRNNNLPLRYYTLMFKKEISNIINSLLPEKQASLACSFLIGDKDLLSDEIRLSFSDSGISHLLAISGAHISIVAQIFMMFFSFLKLKINLSRILTILIIIFFMFLTDFVSSITRSGIMFIIYILGKIFYKPSDPLNSLGFSVFIMSLLNPFISGDIGFLLSVFATLGIILFYFKIKSNLDFIFCIILNISKKLFLNNITNIFSNLKNKIKTFVKFKYNHKKTVFTKEITTIEKFKNIEKNILIKLFSSITALSISSVVFNLPILLLTFDKFSVFFLITNILVSFSMGIIIMLLFISLFCFLLPEPFSFITKFFIKIVEFFLNYIIICSDFIKNLPFSTVKTNKAIILIVFASSLILFSFSFMLHKNHYLKIASTVLSFIILMISVISYQLKIRNAICLSIKNEGKGMLITLNQNNRLAIIPCLGKNRYFKNYCFDNEKIDLILLQNKPFYNYDFIEKILKHNNSNLILLPKSNNEPSFLHKNQSCIFANNASVKLWKNVEIELIKKDNNFWTKLKIFDVSVLICPENSDISKSPKNFKNCDFAIFSTLPKNFNLLKAKYLATIYDVENYNKNFKSVTALNKILLPVSRNFEFTFEFPWENSGKDVIIKKSL
ncbi:MAG: competence protein ComEC family protein [Oscillospiraceae bacterium]|jgi:competence protein ComEC|nr:competence protein ComEC family protein [Oscillospiraceae bacterium]